MYVKYQLQIAHELITRRSPLFAWKISEEEENNVANKIR